MELDLADLGKGPSLDALDPLLKGLRDDIAELAVPAPGDPGQDGVRKQSHCALVAPALALPKRCAACPIPTYMKPSAARRPISSLPTRTPGTWALGASGRLVA